MPRGKKKTTKPIKDTEKELTEDIEKEQEQIEPVTFQYVGNLTKTTTLVGIIEKNIPFTVSDANQINHFRNLNTFEELPKGYKIEKKEEVNLDIEYDIHVKMPPKKTYSINLEDSSADIIDESKTDGTGKEIKDEMVEE